MDKLEKKAEKFRKSTVNQMFVEKSAYKAGVKDSNQFIDFNQMKKEFKQDFDYLEISSIDREEIFRWMKEQISRQFVQL